MVTTFEQLVHHAATKTPLATAMIKKDSQMSYQVLSWNITQLSLFLHSKCVVSSDSRNGQRIAIYLPKQFETVISFFAVTQSGGIFVPVNPLLKASQVNYIFNDCHVSILITSLSRYQNLKKMNAIAGSIHTIILTDCSEIQCPSECITWEKLYSEVRSGDTPESRYSNEIEESPRKSTETAAILYTSGSTGQPKGVVLSHENLIAGAESVVEYLENSSEDRLLALLPFSFDYGLSQLTTAFYVGGTVVLLDYLLPKDVIRAIEKYKITGLAAVPPLWIQLAELDWPELALSLRYITNSGGAMPSDTLRKLQSKLPTTKPILMYGLTEAFRSTYLEPKELAGRPTSIGKAIPNATVLVINNDGKICEPYEEGELVHIGIHVSKGYWNNSEKTKQKFRPLPANLQTEFSSNLAVWSGDIVKADNNGFLYFIGRNDDMIKSSGYRISPAEIEELLQGNDQVKEIAAIGVPHKSLGQAILLIIAANDKTTFDKNTLQSYCRKQLPNYMQPQSIILMDSLPRNANGKINRAILSSDYNGYYS